MAIEKYITEGIILKSYESGENDLTFKVFSKDFGAIFVMAKSIRKITSKLRMKMNVGRFVILTLVKGREVWRLTGVEEMNDFFNDYEKNKIKVNTIICECLNRFLPNEKSQKKLFEKLKGMNEKKFLENIEINNARALIYFIVLVESGYADAKVLGVRDLEEYISFSVNDLYTHFILNEKEIKNHIRKVLSESML